ncbi:hypothetical protein [Parabacteroides sp. PF5-9]|uniref:hypothetical protein n=1 Tax=Parabacteroides sp. PF5-9 TaxID=1742404 RepID=UPI0024771A8F|nr:hypothetical protein [Parabacteroides sp. PF5-9]MDH6357626.1 hypothetical protein [Parabacteroides sp. PF5-9]
MNTLNQTSGITEDYSNYKWYNGESDNPYIGDTERPMAAAFWYYERDFHFSYLDGLNTEKSLKDSYNVWKDELLKEYLPGKSPNPNGDNTNWELVFNTGYK